MFRALEKSASAPHCGILTPPFLFFVICCSVSMLLLQSLVAFKFICTKIMPLLQSHERKSSWFVEQGNILPVPVLVKFGNYLFLNLYFLIWRHEEVFYRYTFIIIQLYPDCKDATNFAFAFRLLCASHGLLCPLDRVETFLYLYVKSEKPFAKGFFKKATM